jgi:FKBP-type peptidyl-prolyl cis-trans isomerase 2
MKVEQGDKISVEYTGKLENGEVFDSSKHGDHSHPIEFVVGNGMVIKGFDNAVLGMEEEEEKQIKISPDEAYGQPNPEMRKDFPRESLPPGQEPKEGMMLILSDPSGRQFPTKITNVDDEKITLDLNHPLAGKTLIFDIKIVNVEKKKE